LDKLFGLDMSTIAACLGSALLVVILVLAVIGWRNNVMLKLGLRPITRRRTQSVLIIVGLMLATLIITAAFVTGDTLSYTIRSLVVEQLGPVDETVRVRSNAGLGSTYFSLSRYDELAVDLKGYPLVDGIVPAIRSNLPAVNQTRRQSVRALQIIGVRPEDTPLALPADLLLDADGNPLSIESLQSREIFLDASAAESLHAEVGDTIQLFVGSSPREFIVRGISGSGDTPGAMMDLRQAQTLFGEGGRINAILVSNTGNDEQGANLSPQVTEKLRGLLTDQEAARRIFSRLTGDSSAAAAIQKAAANYQGNTKADLLSFAAGLRSGTLDEKMRSLLADEGLTNEVQSILDDANWRSDAVRRRLETQFSEISNLAVDETKRDGLDSAELAANAFTTIFVVTGLFGIASGLLLIFLIFVMLAAERKSEMGMTRAIGGQRKHLVQMFVYEGTAYDLAAAAVGVALGVLTGVVIALTLGQAFAASTDLVIRPSVTFKGLAVSYSLGMLVTFGTVLFSANRVSHLNIVAAIRDLPEPVPPPTPLKDRLLAPARVLVDGFRLLARLKVWRAVRTWLLEYPKSLLRLVWMGFRGGILTLLLGILLVPTGLAAQSGALFTLGVSLALIGGGLVGRNVLFMLLKRHRDLAERIAFTAMGLALTIFWSLPSGTFESIGVKDLKSGPEMLFIAGFMMVVGAVMVVMYNTDLVLKVILRALGGGARLAPVLRMAVAYPLANRFRTGLTLGMFGVVVFSVVFMATAFKANDAFFANTEALTGGFQLRAQVSSINPIPDLARSINSKAQLRSGGYDVVAAQSVMPVEMEQEGGSWGSYLVKGVDAAYLDNVDFNLALVADGYADQAEVWRTVRDHPGYAIIDSLAVPSRNNTSVVIGGPSFKMTGFYIEDDSMPPTQLRVRRPGGQPFDVTVIGVLEPGNFAGYGLITSQATLDKALADPPTPTTYFIRLANGVDPEQAASALESAFVQNGLEAVDQVKEIEDQQAVQRAVQDLLLGFLTLGLIVGVAALGVISTRAVVERRQQIGVLRALGFQADMVSWSFMVEASFVALLGISLGAGLALIPAYQLITDTAAEIPGLSFSVPWGSIALVVGLAYGMTLLATYLPSKQASRVLPAEALRYE
jgi:putative ABC transport system permease protein